METAETSIKTGSYEKKRRGNALETPGNVTHITGPPGTGKTQTIAEATRKAVVERGRRVAIASLTNTAANEIRERTGISDRSMVSVGTLHRLCMEAIGVRRDLLVAGHIAEWNEHAKATGSHDWVLTDGDDRSEDPNARGKGQTRGDQFFGVVEDCRQRMAPESQWPALLGMREWWEAYSAWKREEGLYDFTDLIETAAREKAAPPIGGKSPDTFVIDEVQDSTRLEMHYVRDVIGPQIERVILAGDPDQTLYGFRSADPRVFLDYPVPPEQDRVLSQSYRVPRSVHAFALGIIRRIEDRIDVAYQPRDEEGEVVARHQAFAAQPERLMPDLARWLDEGSVMILAPTEFSLRPLLSVLRKEGIPFANPWAPDRGDWNPIRRARKGETSTLDRFLAFYPHESAIFPHDSRERDWTRGELLTWIPVLAATGCLRRGIATHLEQHLSDPWTSEEFASLFVDDSHAISAYDRDTAWLLAHAKPAKRRTLEYLLHVAAKQGMAALEEPPTLFIGTVHSVKGAQADTVVVFPDVTPAMWRAQATRAGMDAQTRTFYVAATRAKRRLVICQPSSRMRYPL